MNLRRALALGTAGLAATAALSACGFNYPTDRINNLVAGVDDRSGTVEVLNAAVVSQSDNSGTFVATLPLPAVHAADAAPAKAAAPAGTRVVAVTVLTSLDGDDLESIGVPPDPHAQVERLTLLARQAGLDGVVCSGNEVKAAKKLWPHGFFVVPGIRPAPGNGHADQKRVMTPRQALDQGASILVIGRPITQAEDPDVAARAIEATL